MTSRCSFQQPEFAPPGLPALPPLGVPTPPAVALRADLPGVSASLPLPAVGAPALPSAGLPSAPTLAARANLPGVSAPSLVPPGAPALPSVGLPPLPIPAARPCPLDA